MYINDSQARFSAMMPRLSNLQFGNEIFANYQGSSARFSGNMPFEQNYQIGANQPVPFDFQTIFGGFQALNTPPKYQNADGTPNEGGGEITGTEGAAKTFIKTLGAFATGELLLFVGLIMLLFPLYKKL
jgi:hypothetical protein